MPELPEVEALATDLRERVVGHAVHRVDVAAISALKTFDPPPTALAGKMIVGAGRHGKFLDLTIAADDAAGRRVICTSWCTSRAEAGCTIGTRSRRRR